MRHVRISEFSSLKLTWCLAALLRAARVVRKAREYCSEDMFRGISVLTNTYNHNGG